MAESTSAPGRTASADAAELTQRLVRFDTSNPPGDVRECIEFLRTTLEASGIETTLRARSAERPNLIARLPGRGAAPPLILHGHVDVVPAAADEWTHPPFAGEVVDGVLWGRGTVDMKGGLALMVAAMLRARDTGLVPAGDVILAAFSDQETGSESGAAWLVAEHPELFEGARYAIGEQGAFSFEVSGRRFYPIGVTEKQACSLRVVVTGKGGHGSVPVRDGAMRKVAEIVARLDKGRLPVHITPVAYEMLMAIADEVSGVEALALRSLRRRRLTDRVLDVIGEDLAAFDPLLHNTVTPTKIKASERVDVIPGAVELHLDGRVLPGFTPEQLLEEARALCGDLVETIELDAVWEAGAGGEPDMGLFDALSASITEVDPDGVPIPMVFPAITDGRFLARLGIQHYGYLPMRLPPELQIAELAHAVDERVTVEALRFGGEVMFGLLGRFGDAADDR